MSNPCALIGLNIHYASPVVNSRKESNSALLCTVIYCLLRKKIHIYLDLAFILQLNVGLFVRHVDEIWIKNGSFSEYADYYFPVNLPRFKKTY